MADPTKENVEMAIWPMVVTAVMQMTMLGASMTAY